MMEMMEREVHEGRKKGGGACDQKYIIMLYVMVEPMDLNHWCLSMTR